jgi:hypothetical protein
VRSIQIFNDKNDPSLPVRSKALFSSSKSSANNARSWQHNGWCGARPVVTDAQRAANRIAKKNRAGRAAAVHFDRLLAIINSLAVISDAAHTSEHQK